MINPDELDAPHLNKQLRDLQPMSVQELEDYIATLEAEIDRARAAIAKKESHRSGAAALFGGS